MVDLVIIIMKVRILIVQYVILSVFNEEPLYQQGSF